MAAIAHRTLVVLDRCVLLARPELVLRPDEGIVIPDAYIAEMAEGDRTDTEPGQFLRWVRRFPERVYVAGYWWDLINAEGSCNRKARMEDVIRCGLTKKLRQIVQAEPLPDWSAGAKELAGWSDHGYSVGRKQFLQLASLFRQWIDQDKPDFWAPMARGAATDEERMRFVRDPDQSAVIAPIWLEWMGYDGGRYRSEPWQRQLKAFPDRCAAGRWARLILWYFVKWAVGETSKFKNNWDDMHYALVASYTGHLATHDKGLAEAMAVVFPDCAVRTSPVR